MDVLTRLIEAARGSLGSTVPAVDLQTPKEGTPLGVGGSGSGFKA